MPRWPYEWEADTGWACWNRGKTLLTSATVSREVDPPEKLVFTWAWEKMSGDDSNFVPAETLVTVEFLDKNGATEVVLTQEQFSDEHMRDEHEGGWAGCLDGLDRLFQSES